MFRFILLLAVLATTSFADDLPNLGVIGGLAATPGQFSYQVSIQLNGRQHCGGTIIDRSIILTAAHCLIPNKDLLKVVAGTNNRYSGGIRVNVSKHIAHESFDPITLAYDIGIIVLEEPLPDTNQYKPAQLPAKNEIIYNNQIGVVSGWGAQFHKGPTTPHLNFASIPLWSREYCTNVLKVPLQPTHLCAGDITGQVSSCPGDSGGPLTIGKKIVGVVSAGFGCGAIYTPGLYTYVAGLLEWILTNAEINYVKIKL